MMPAIVCLLCAMLSTRTAFEQRTCTQQEACGHVQTFLRHGHGVLQHLCELHRGGILGGHLQEIPSMFPRWLQQEERVVQ